MARKSAGTGRKTTGPKKTSAKRSEGAADLDEYRAKRDFRVTPEPERSAPSTSGNMFVVQMHDATRLHYDFRIEMGGLLKSWAVTRGPSLDPKVKRLAVRTEDHPVSYGRFEGTIPKGEYGGGSVIVWDTGTWVPMTEDPEADYARGDMKFRLDGHKMKGGWALVRIKGERASGKDWLLIKERDIYARPEADGIVTEERPESVLSGLTVQEMEDRANAAPLPRAAKPLPKPARIKGAKKADLPDVPRPQLATLAAQPADDDGWLHEIKFDGYRTIARIADGEARLFTRNGHDWTDRYRPIADFLARLPCKTALIDGEVCVQTPTGATSFGLLQDALSEGAAEKLTYFAFDLMYLDGWDLGAAPLAARKDALEGLLQAAVTPTSPVHFSDHHEGGGPAFFAQAANLGLEGIISKRADAPYTAGRSKTWLKVKTSNAGDFEVVGFADGKAGGGLGALLLAERQNHKLHYVGKVGTGFTEREGARLRKALQVIAREGPIASLVIDPESAAEVKGATWVQPKLVVEVEYAERTGKDHLRAPRYKGLRPDKPAGSGDAPVKPKLVTDAVLASLWITNPEREMFGPGGPTKLDLALYYARVGDWMLPEIVNRPITLVRCPTGKLEDTFYQRHASDGMPPEIKKIAMYGDDSEKERDDYLYIEDAKGLLSLSQFGVIEFHPWGCRIDNIEKPDRIVFDLDPDESLGWHSVVDAAFQVRDELEDLGIESFVRTTGGKGLHVVMAIERRHDWKEMKEFSHNVVRLLARKHPRRYTDNPQKPARKGKIFADYLRNGRGATAVASYSLRARAGAPVATPVPWEELGTIEDPRDFDWRTVPERLAQLSRDPWEDLDKSAVRLTADIKKKVTVNK
jgi:bifunctional non-homologous end joining protein LigD